MEECIKVKLIDESAKLTPHFKKKFGHERLVSLKSIKGRYKRGEVEYFLFYNQRKCIYVQIYSR